MDSKIEKNGQSPSNEYEDEPSEPATPVGGAVYDSPVTFSGTNHYLTINQWTAFIKGHFKPQGPSRDDYPTSPQTKDFSFLVDVPPGPTYVSTHYYASGIGAEYEESKWHDTGWFYVLTPPE